jgi:hypothetical protein
MRANVAARQQRKGNAARLLRLLQIQLLVLALVAKRPQGKCLLRKRMDWAHGSKILLAEGQFMRCYKMSYRAFEELVEKLAPALQVNELQSKRRTGTKPITPVNQVHMCVRWFGGGSYHDIRKSSGVSKTAFYASVHRVIAALISHPDLKIQFPSDEQALRESAREFTRLSSGGMLTGCVGALDGWLCPIKVPRKKEVGRVTSFFSGHYHRYGVNVQACCDHLSRFTFVSCSSAGGCGDSLAFTRTSLAEKVATLPVGIYLTGDNAYVNSNQLLTPFPKPKITTQYQDSYNYHLSQLRIRIEMAFGLLVKKMRIFRAPLEVKFANVSKVIMAGCVLHNWCINARLRDGAHYSVRDDLDLVEALSEQTVLPVDTRLGPDETVSEEDASPYRELYCSGDRSAGLHADSECMRNAIVKRLERNNIVHPGPNVIRRQEQDANV